jgi:hypothetical protein
MSGNAILTGKEYDGRGWVVPELSKMALSKRWVRSLDNESPIYVSTGPTLLGTEGPVELVNACKTAIAGSGTKNSQDGVWADTDLSLDLGTNKSFGVLVRITNSPNLFKFGSYEIELLDNATSLGVIKVRANSVPLDIIILGISNVAGVASVIPVAQPIVKFTDSTNNSLAAGDVLYAETLNQRDLGKIENARGVI